MGHMVDYGEFLDGLAEALSKRGHSITRNIGPGRYVAEILAAKGELSASKGNFAHFIVVTTMDLPSPESVTEFSQAAWAFSLANSRKYLPDFPTKGRFNNRVIVPVTVSQAFSDEMKSWISGKNPAKHSPPFANLPVLISSSNGEAYYCRKIPFLGAVPWRGVRKFVEEVLAPAAMESLRPVDGQTTSSVT